MKSKIIELLNYIKNRLNNSKENVTQIVKKEKNISLTYKIWIYFVLFAVSIFIILWFMQVIFLQSYYSSMKKNEVVKLATKIEEEYSSGDFSDYIDSVAYKNVSNIYIINKVGNIVYSSNSNTQNSQLPTRPYVVDLGSVINTILESPNHKMNYTLKLDKLKSEIFIYGKQIQNSDDYLIMVTSIDPIDATTNVLKGQLVYITIISLIISSIISIFISRNLSKPIKQINESAKKLANGNYNIKFQKAGYFELDELADTLNFATEQLEKTDKIRKELIANVSHDLRTPLTMIKAYSEMIRDLSGDNKEKREEHLQVIIDETDRLGRLVNDMMDLSKIESGITTLNKERINLSEITKNIVKGLNIESDNCKFILNIQEDCIVMADKTKIEQVMYNLINNAINHSLQNKVIEVNVKSTGKKVRFEVIDNGPGISKEDLQHIWTRYYKIDKTYQRSSTGTGLGLSIVKNILEKHEAEYGVESELGKGSNFWFELEKVK